MAEKTTDVTVSCPIANPQATIWVADLFVGVEFDSNLFAMEQL